LRAGEIVSLELDDIHWRAAEIVIRGKGRMVDHLPLDSEYGSVVNASLPFEHCAAHVGGEGWGWQGVSFGDLQVRAYVTSLSAEDVLLRVKMQGFRAAENIAEGQDGFATVGKALFSASTDQGWQQATIAYPLGYGDYGGTAPIDFYVRNAGRYRLVLVFMGADAVELIPSATLIFPLHIS
jgi:hypothetical protein